MATTYNTYKFTGSLKRVGFLAVLTQLMFGWVEVLCTQKYENKGVFYEMCQLNGRYMYNTGLMFLTIALFTIANRLELAQPLFGAHANTISVAEWKRHKLEIERASKLKRGYGTEERQGELMKEKKAREEHTKEYMEASRASDSRESAIQMFKMTEDPTTALDEQEAYQSDMHDEAQVNEVTNHEQATGTSKSGHATATSEQHQAVHLETENKDRSDLANFRKVFISAVARTPSSGVWLGLSALMFVTGKVFCVMV